MARAALDWTVRQLAGIADVRPNTVSNFENGRGVQLNTVKALRQAFLDTGRVRFEGDNCVCVDSAE